MRRQPIVAVAALCCVAILVTFDPQKVDDIMRAKQYKEIVKKGSWKVKF